MCSVPLERSKVEIVGRKWFLEGDGALFRFVGGVHETEVDPEDVGRRGGVGRV